jgi:hypothetical protein
VVLDGDLRGGVDRARRLGLLQRLGQPPVQPCPPVGVEVVVQGVPDDRVDEVVGPAGRRTTWISPAPTASSRQPSRTSSGSPVMVCRMAKSKPAVSAAAACSAALAVGDSRASRLASTCLTPCGTPAWPISAVSTQRPSCWTATRSSTRCR